MFSLNKKNSWILLVIAGLLIMSMYGSYPKEAVADIEGKTCTSDENCPCIGTYAEGTTQETSAFGIGTGSCKSSKCDMTYCLGLEPIGDWVRDNPWAWVKDGSNILVILSIIGLIGGYIYLRTVV